MAIQWTTPAGSIGLFVANTAINFQFQAEILPVPAPPPGATITYTLLNGSFPAGQTTPLTLNSATGQLTGTVGSVSSDTTSEFTIRATSVNADLTLSIRDRTFSMTVSGQAIPYFTTPTGSLLTTNDSTWVSSQVNYVDQTGDAVIRVAIGSLPPGLEINSTGLVRGYAIPPTGVSQVYNFTLEIVNSNGSSLTAYSITVINQATLPGFNGRIPALLNNQPLSFSYRATDPDREYYITGTSIGNYIQNDKFIFKFIGYDFNTRSENGITYTVIGLNNAVTLTGETVSANTGWYNGQIKQIGASVQTFNIVIRVSVPGNAPGTTLTSPDIVLSLTVVGDIATQITWLTDSDLGSINNGAVSEFAVRAASASELKYRVVGKDVSTNIKTIVYTNTSPVGTDNFLTFGDQGSWAKGAETFPSNPNDPISWVWTSQPAVTNTYNELYFNSSIYLLASTLIVGRNQSNNGVMYVYDPLKSFLPAVIPSPNGAREFTSVERINSRLIVTGSLITSTGYTGLIAYSDNATDPFFIFAVTLPSIGGSYGLNSIAYGGPAGNNRYVAVGDNGVIVASPGDALTGTWVSLQSTSLYNLKSVVWTGYRFVAVGDQGTIVTCVPVGGDPTQWKWIASAPLTYNLRTIIVDTVSKQILAAGDNGTIISSIENQASYLEWLPVENRLTTSNLYNVIQRGDRYYFVGDVGTIIECVFSIALEQFVLTSPTLNLPPNLTLLANGDIAGRLAFESQTTVSPRGLTTPYTFTVQAYNPAFETINSNKTFTLTTVQKYYYPYDNIYMKLMPGSKNKPAVYDLCNSASLVKDEYLYRPTDPNFGHQSEVIFWHTYGLPSIPSIASVGNESFYDQYITTVQKNFYWRNLTLGAIKTAEARNSKDEVIYEVVYSEIIDDLITNKGVSISKEVNWPRTIAVDNSDYWSSTTQIVADATYYDREPVVHRVVAISADKLEITLDSVDGLYYMSDSNQVTNTFSEMTAAADALVTYKDVPYPAEDPPIPAGTLSEPPVVIAVDRVTNVITVDEAQVSLAVGDQVVFSIPATASLTSELSTTLYPASTDNMREQLYSSFGTLSDETVLPKWMTSKQSTGRTLGYVPAYVIAYAKPGFAAKIKADIETNWGYRLNDIQFTVDRIEVDRSLTYDYLGQTIGTYPPYPGWTTLPSAQPYPAPVDSKNTYVYYPQQTILPGVKRQ